MAGDHSIWILCEDTIKSRQNERENNIREKQQYTESFRPRGTVRSSYEVDELKRGNRKIHRQTGRTGKWKKYKYLGSLLDTEHVHQTQKRFSDRHLQ